MSLKVGELHATLGIRDRDFKRGVDKAGRKFSKFGSGLKRTAGVAAVGAGVAIAGLATKGVKEFASLERGMNEVFTLLPDISGEAMGDLTGQVRDFAQEFGTLPDEVVPSLYQAISAGVPKDNVFDFLETAQKAAIGGVTELETAVDGISSVVNSYGSDVIDATKASDLMFTAVRLGKTNFEELSQSLFQVLPTASSLGVEFGDVTAAMAAMTSQGTPTRVATTQLRQMLVELSKEGQQAAVTFEELSGQSFAEFIAQGGTVEEALKMMGDAAKGQGGNIADLFGSVEAGMGATALTSESGSKAFSNALGEMSDSAGATEGAYDQMDQGVSRSLDKMKARANELALEFGEELAPSLVDAGDSLMQLAETVLPAVETGLKMVASAANGFTFIIDGIGDAFGLTDGRAADLARSSEFLAAALENGEDPAAALANALVDMARTGDLTEEQMKRLARQSGLSDERLADVEQTLRDYAASGKEAEITTDEMNAAFGIQQDAIHDLDGETRALFGAAGELTEATEEGAEAQDEMTEATEDATSALREQFDEMKAQVDPVFALRDATRDAAAAQERVNEAIEEHGEGSSEHLEALQAASEANYDLRDAELAVEEAAGLTRDAFIEQQTEMGLTREEATLLADDLAALDEFEFEPKHITLSAQMSAEDRRLFGSAGVAGLQHGGPARRGQLYEIGEGNRPELFEGADGGLFMLPGNRGRVLPFGDLNRMVASAEMMMSSRPDRSQDAPQVMRSETRNNFGPFIAQGTPESLVGDLVDQVGLEIRFS